MLEGELRGLHADDVEAVVVVALVPGLDVGERSLAVDARVGPEVDQHHVAAQRFQRERPSPFGVLSHVVMPVNCGAATAFGEALGIAGRGVAFARA